MCDIDISSWVQEETNSDRKTIRQAIHTILHAIALSDELRNVSYIKGGILLAIRYDSDRFTNDIDFSSGELFSPDKVDSIRDALEEGLLEASQALDYSLLCRVQRCTPKPKKPGKFQSLEINVGFAYVGSPQYPRLMKGKAPHTLSIDYSFNEPQLAVEQLNVINCGSLQAYSLHDLIAEKYRAILQQSIRKRNRGQDLYDLQRIISDSSLIFSDEDKSKILESLRLKCSSRELHVDSISLQNEDIIRRTKEGYSTIADDVLNLPDFDTSYSVILAFYSSLPWD